MGMLVDESQDSFIVYPSDYVAGFDETDNDIESEVSEEEDDFVTSPIDTMMMEVVTPISETVVTEERIEEVMEQNTKITSILQNTLEMQALLFNKFFGYIG